MKKTFVIPPRKAVAAWVLGIFSVFAICISVYAAAGRCVPCRANHYCPLGGIPYLCPADKPVTSGTGHDAQSDCMSCATRNGQGQPFFGGYQLGEGYECVSCVENDLTKPFWNGSECVACATADASKPVWNNGTCEACPEDTTWDSTEGECVANATSNADCAFTIPHNGGTLCLVESVVSSVYGQYAPQSAEEETAQFKTKYGIVNTSDSYPDNWAGAMKYCQDKGLRLPSLEEFISISEVLYATEHPACTSSRCSTVEISRDNCMYYDLAVSNIELWNFLKNGTPSDESISGEFYFWTRIETYPDTAVSKFFASDTSTCYGLHDRAQSFPGALCIK